MTWTKDKTVGNSREMKKQHDVLRGAALRGELMSEESQRQKLQAETAEIAAV